MKISIIEFLKFLTMSKSSPTTDQKACLCENGTYSKDCCKGELINQGIGSDSEQGSSTIVNTNSERVISNSN